MPWQPRLVSYQSLSEFVESCFKNSLEQNSAYLSEDPWHSDNKETFCYHNTFHFSESALLSTVEYLQYKNLLHFITVNRDKDLAAVNRG